MGNRFKAFRIAHDLATVITLPEHAYGYALENTDGEIWWVVWQHAAETPPEMTLPASPIEALSMTGEELTIKTLTFALSEYPVFLRMPNLDTSSPERTAP